MPIYEYICEHDGTVIELVRPMADADKPVRDPENKGRSFRRKLSMFSAPAAASSNQTGQALCPCGKSPGSCSAR